MLETFDYVLHYTVYSDRTAKAGENYVRFAVDVGQRRLYTDSVVGKAMNNKLIYKDGTGNGLRPAGRRNVYAP